MQKGPADSTIIVHVLYWQYNTIKSTPKIKVRATAQLSPTRTTIILN
jgi:hypothetical protein